MNFNLASISLCSSSSFFSFDSSYLEILGFEGEVFSPMPMHFSINC